MTPIDLTTEFAKFATAVMAEPADVTHLIRIGQRNCLDVYAVGWWAGDAYHSGIITHDGTRFGSIRYGTDMDITR